MFCHIRPKFATKKIYIFTWVFYVFISIFLCFQGFASSAESAQMESQKEPQNRRSFLLGAMSKVKSLPLNDRVRIADTLHISVTRVPVVGFVSSKAYLFDIGFHGSVVYKGETIIADISGNETVLLIKNFLSIRCTETECATLLAVGPSYPPLTAEDGSQASDFWSGFIKVKAELGSELFFFPLDCIKRRVILYSCGDGVFTVADYQRQARQLPYTIVVPVYIECGDMLLIQGEQLEDFWFGHVQSVDHCQRTIDVFFFIESSRHNNLYVRETQGRHARNTVSWHSVIGIASGKWLSHTQWRKDE